MLLQREPWNDPQIDHEPICDLDRYRTGQNYLARFDERMSKWERRCYTAAFVLAIIVILSSAAWMKP